MSLSILFEKSLKAQIVNILLSGNSRTAEQIFIELKKKSLSFTKRGVYKALNELLNQKFILKYNANYEISPEWISLLSNDATKAIKSLLERNLIGINVRELKALCDCGKGYAEGFCSICNESICSHCGFEELIHDDCSSTCLSCNYGHQEGICPKCNKPICLKCGKKIWIHEHQFCKKQDKQIEIGILEVDHDCWFANASENENEIVVLNSFSDKQDKINNTHSGILKISKENKSKLINQIQKEKSFKEIKPFHQTDKYSYLRTRALINKSVDEFTKENRSVLLNPILAIGGKEQNLILSPSQKEMKQLSKMLRESGGNARILKAGHFDIRYIKDKEIKRLIEIASKKELMEGIQRVRLVQNMNRLNF